MKPKGDFEIWLLLIIVGQAAGVSYNQLKFCPNPSWSPNATTFANIKTFGRGSRDIFINTNNTVYIANYRDSRIVVWANGSNVPTRNISGNLSYPMSLFVTTSDDIYVDTFMLNGGVSKRSLNAASNIEIMHTCKQCYDLFVDIADTLYCSINKLHQVVTQSLNSNSNILTIIAGTGTAGSVSTMLDKPHGIFVDINLDLYVADSNNDRIQLFRSGELHGITVAGSTSSNITIQLKYPTGIVLDAEKYLFIVDNGHHRIVRSSPTGFHCIIGCSGSVGSASNELDQPWSLSFDSYGNIFVSDYGNDRVQKFVLSTSSCTINTTLTTTTILGLVVTTSNFLPTANNVLNKSTGNLPNIISYNLPKFDGFASWSANAVTFAASNTIGTLPYGVFVNTNNEIYAADRSNNRILVWSNDSINPRKILSGHLSSPYAIFATSNGDIYVDNGYSNGRVDKWTSTANTSAAAMYVGGECFGLFVDINDVLYCSIKNLHQVVTKSLSSISNKLRIVAGRGCDGSTSDMLNNPYGIFVDINLDLYVADSGNDRIQLFQSGQLNGTTVAGGTSSSTTITLNQPSAIVLDAEKYLFIVDQYNHRIVASGPTGFRCIVGCHGGGSASNQLAFPRSMAFDSYGNIFVTDWNNNRIQKFIYLNYSLVVSYNQPKFCPTATWNSNATTFANRTAIGTQPYGMFVNLNNTIYVADKQHDKIRIYFKDTSSPSQTISGNLSNLYAIFVTNNGDIYVNYDKKGNSIKSVDKWTLGASTGTSVMTVNSACYGLFVDISNTLYCSLRDEHKVVKRWLDDNSAIVTTTAGTGYSSRSSNGLDEPYGIFVDINFDLYVADSGNGRIQLFRFGQLNGITVAGTGSTTTTTITLYYPTGIVLDAEKYLFIVDRNNHRIIGSGPNGFRCLVGCYGTGSKSGELNSPQSLVFDSNGNIFVTDTNNSRVQKFVLTTNSCGQHTTHQSPIIQGTTAIQKTTSITDLETTTIEEPTAMLGLQTRPMQKPTITADLQTTSLKEPTAMADLQTTANLKMTSMEDLETTAVDESTAIADLQTTSAQESTSMTDLEITRNSKSTSVVDLETTSLQERTLMVDSVTTLNQELTAMGELGSTLIQEPTSVVDLETTSVEESTGMTDLETTSMQKLTLVPNFETALVEEPTTFADLETTSIQEPNSVADFVTTSYQKAPSVVDFEITSIQGPVSVADSETTSNYELISMADLGTTSVQELTITAYLEITSNQKPTSAADSQTTLVRETASVADLVTTLKHELTIMRELGSTSIQESTSVVDLETALNQERTSVADLEITSNYELISVADLVTTSNGKLTSLADLVTTSTRKTTLVTDLATTSNGKTTSVIDLVTTSKEKRTSMADSARTTIPQTTSMTDSVKTSMQQTTSITDSARTSMQQTTSVTDSAKTSMQQTTSITDSARTSMQQTTSITDSARTSMQQTTSVTDSVKTSMQQTTSMTDSAKTSMQQTTSMTDSARTTTQQTTSMTDSARTSMQQTTSVTDSVKTSMQQTTSMTDSAKTSMQQTTSMTDSARTTMQQTTSMADSVKTAIKTPGVLADTTSSFHTFRSESASTWSTDSLAITNSPPLPFFPPSCPGQNIIGVHCNISSAPCEILKPCQNNGTCANTNTTVHGYNCICPPGFDGDRCEADRRPCKEDTCWNNGTCNETSSTTFECLCQNGWRGDHCESIVNYCDKVICLNNAVCRPSFLNYTCECLGTSYSGRHCEIVATAMVVRQMVSKSFGYIAIIFLVVVVAFFVIMDILKYCFGIDPTKDELEKIRRAKAAVRRARRRSPVIERFVYVNAPPERPPTTQKRKINSDIEETSI